MESASLRSRNVNFSCNINFDINPFGEALVFGNQWKASQQFFQRIAQDDRDLVRCRDLHIGCPIDWLALTRSKHGETPPYLPYLDQNHSDLLGKAVMSMEAGIAFINGMSLVKRFQSDLEAIKSYKSTVLLMEDFILKVKHVLRCETELEIRFMEHRRNITDFILVSSLRLPKLGKVYVEICSCIECCNEATVNLSRSSNHNAMRWHSLKNRLIRQRGKLLLYVKWLIYTRIRNIGHIVTMGINDNIKHCDFFSSNEGKRFCKLIDIYNKSCIEHWKSSEIPINLVNTFVECITEFIPVQTLSKKEGHYYQVMKRSCTYPFVVDMLPVTVWGVLDSVSEGFVLEFGLQIMNVLNYATMSRHEIFTDLSSHAKLIDIGQTWKLASNIKIQPAQLPNHGSSFARVVKQIGKFTIPDNFNSEELGQICTLFMKLFDCQETVMYSFMTGLGGKTNVLQKSINNNELPDDAVSVTTVSSSRTSCSIVQNAEMKSVTWKDSWSSEVMKAITTNRMAFLSNSISHYFCALQHGGKSALHALFSLFTEQDIDLIVMQSVVSNVGKFHTMTEAVQRSLYSSAIEVIVDAALSCSDFLMSEMLGKSTVHFDKLSVWCAPRIDGICSYSCICIGSLHSLYHILEAYSQCDIIAKTVISLIEPLLSRGLYWMKSKLQYFFFIDDIPSALKMVLFDLQALTNVAINGLKLVETCHNHAEKQRSLEFATLLLTTKCLHNIDSLITNMQITSTSTMTQITEHASQISAKFLAENFPPQKLWVQKSLINAEVENKYVQEIIHNLIKPVCAVLSGLDSQSQLAGVVPVVCAIYEAFLKHIALLRIKFSVQGGLQLDYDFANIRNFITCDATELSFETRDAISSIRSVKRAMEICQLLHGMNNVYASGQSSHTQISSERSCSFPLDGSNVMDLEDEFWLTLRKCKSGRTRAWTSLLPCFSN